MSQKDRSMSAQPLLKNYERAICGHGHGLRRCPARVFDLVDGIVPCPAVFVPAVSGVQVPVAASADALQVEEGHGPEPVFYVVRDFVVAADAVGQQGVLAVAAQHAVLAVSVDAV
jgi:hypothetical protein